MCMQKREMKNLINVYLTVFISLSYSYFIASRFPKGKLRFLSLSPVFFIFILILLPLQLSSVLPTALTVLFISWLSTFKLILFSFDSRPLSSHHHSKSLISFLLISSLPIKTTQSPTKIPKLPLTSPIKTLLFFLLLPTLNQKHNLHPSLLLAIYCSLLYLLIDVVSGFCNSVTKSVFGMELEMASDEPYLSSSLQDFWGRRWNLMVTAVLREAVYNPVRSICGPTLGSAIVGVVAAFGVKELLGRPNWGVCSLVYGPMMVVFVIVTAHWWFFTPVVRTGADERAAKEFMNLLECLMGKVGLSA